MSSSARKASGHKNDGRKSSAQEKKLSTRERDQPSSSSNQPSSSSSQRAQSPPKPHKGSKEKEKKQENKQDNSRTIPSGSHSTRDGKQKPQDPDPTKKPKKSRTDTESPKDAAAKTLRSFDAGKGVRDLMELGIVQKRWVANRRNLSKSQNSELKTLYEDAQNKICKVSDPNYDGWNANLAIEASNALTAVQRFKFKDTKDSEDIKSDKEIVRRWNEVLKQRWHNDGIPECGNIYTDDKVAELKG